MQKILFYKILFLVIKIFIKFTWTHYFLIVFSKKKEQFPVKLTEPLTPILYITADLEHMKGLKEVIHVKEIAEGKILSRNRN